MRQRKEQRSNRTQKAASNAPDLIAYSVQSRGDDKDAIWTRLGAGWEHKDGKGYDIRCQALPVDGRLTLRFRDNAKNAADDYEQGGPEPEGMR